MRRHRPVMRPRLMGGDELVAQMARQAYVDQRIAVDMAYLVVAITELHAAESVLLSRHAGPRRNRDPDLLSSVLDVHDIPPPLTC